MKILVINTGSSSLKYQLIEDEKTLIKGLVNEIGSNNSKLTFTIGENKESKDLGNVDYDTAIKVSLESLKNKEIITDNSQINAVGHRVVHGGEKYSDSILIDKDVINTIDELSDLAPLHNPANLKGIRACMAQLPIIPHIAVFDTAFHQTLPKEAYLYGLPFELYEKYKIRKYGFHGTSHKYVAHKAAEILGKDIKDLKIISCHIGNGASITAIKEGKSIDTSMGFTPLEGLVMGTRSGDIDPSIVEFLCKKEGLTVEEVTKILNKKSGLLGLSKKTNDVRALHDNPDRYTTQALEVYVHRIIKYIGSYIPVLGGIDVIIFTAGVGEHAWYLREKILTQLDFLRIGVDIEKNKANEIHISKPDSYVKCLMIPTNEELQIAREVTLILNE